MDLVVPLTRRITIPNTGLNTDSFVVTQPVNASDGKLDGIELGFVYFPENLPGILQGLRRDRQLHQARFGADHSAHQLRGRDHRQR